MRKVLVLGDVILDQTTHVRVKGISPESDHVLAVRPDHVTYNPGGAANVAVGIKALGGDPYLLGLISADDDSRKLIEQLHQNKVPTLLDFWHGGRTTSKERIVTRTGQLLRLDREWRGDLSANYWSGDGMLAKTVQHELLKPGDPAPLVCLVDYDKGFFTDQAVSFIMGLLRGTHFDMPVVVDPGRHGDWGRFGSPRTLFKANLKQALMHYAGNRVTNAGLMPLFDTRVDLDSNAVYMEKFYHRALEAVRHNLFQLGTAFRYVVLTFGAGGVGLISDTGETLLVPSEPVQVTDPCGAGDTVMAMLADVIAKTEFTTTRVKMACICAEAAARIAVQKRGVHAVRADEVGVNAWELLRHCTPRSEEAQTTSSPTGEAQTSPI